MRKFGALLFALFVNSVRGQLSQDPVATRAPKRLSATAVENLARMNDLQQFTQLLAPLMVRRVPATPPHAEVRRFIIDRLEKSGFNVWTHDFEARVPFIDNIISGQKLPFSNIVATFHPNAPRKLVFACHYDSKYFHPNSRFIGAIDSAVPCAMLLDMARTLGPHLAQLQSPEVTLQLVFFDGEEAFGQWSSTDSLYGSRALAQFWETTGELGSIDMLVLLDLLGGELGSCRSGLFRSCPELSSYMRSTQGFFDRMVQIEETLHRKKLLAAHQGVRRYLQTEPKYHVGIEDDHVPFMKRGVRIVHAITAPFPSTWHQESDDADSLHWPTIQNLNTIFRAAAAEYLGLGSI